MSWLERHQDLRKHPSKILDSCRTVISLAYPYGAGKPSTPEGLTTARYTEPEAADYHIRLRALGRRLAETVDRLFPGSRSRVCVDSAPILERSFAYLSGIGFIGKNNMLIIPGHGSYIFLAEILSTAVIESPETGSMPSRCGSCTRCIEACPSGALEGPYSINASRCISYLSVEHPGRLDLATAGKMGSCFFGCDVCQEVCPYNPKTGPQPSLPSARECLEMENEDFRRRFGKTAFARAGLDKIRGNIRAVCKCLDRDASKSPESGK